MGAICAKLLEFRDVVAKKPTPDNEVGVYDADGSDMEFLMRLLA